MIKELDEIKGVGEKVKETLITYYGSEAMALRSIEEGEYERILEAGVPFHKAVDIARYVESKKYDFTYSNIMKTTEAKTLYNEVFEILSSYPKTAFGRVGISLFHPTIDRKEIQRRLNFVIECVKRASHIKKRREELEVLFSNVTVLKEGRPKMDDVIAMEDRDFYDELTGKILNHGNLLLIERIDDLEYLKDYEFVRYHQGNSTFSTHAMELINVEPVYEDDFESLIPEVIISFYGINKECILSAIKIAAISGDPELLDIAERLESDKDAIEATDPIGLAKGKDNKLGNLESALNRLEETLQSSLDDANKTVSEKIGSMALKGDELLTVLRMGEGSRIFDILPKEFSDNVLITAKEHEEVAAEKLGIDNTWTRGLFSADTYPLAMDFSRLAEVKAHLRIEKMRLEFETKQRVAKRLSKHVPAVETLIRKTMNLDLTLAIGWFSIDNGLTKSRIQERGGIGIKKGVNLHLRDDAEPVDYVIGACDLFPENDERAVVLTGANSGGKTTLLELLAQTVLLTHMGLGVPAEEASTSLFEEVYYFGKGQGTNAGAFESLLKTFERLGKSGKKRLILADEIEAITEPGAAAKILVALLDWLKEDEKTLILIVTHLGGDIAEHVGGGVRIDGIAAAGLDKALNLIVNRNPVLGMVAKSTPELIVERLSKISSKTEFYNWILKRFKD